MKKWFAKHIEPKLTEYILLMIVFGLICFKHYPYLKDKFEDRQTQDDFYYRYYDYTPPQQ